MRVGRGSWHVLRLHVPRAAACAANDVRSDDGSGNRDRKFFILLQRAKLVIPSCVPCTATHFSRRAGCSETLSPHLGGGILPE